MKCIRLSLLLIVLILMEGSDAEMRVETLFQLIGVYPVLYLSTLLKRESTEFAFLKYVVVHAWCWFQLLEKDREKKINMT